MIPSCGAGRRVAEEPPQPATSKTVNPLNQKRKGPPPRWPPRGNQVAILASHGGGPDIHGVERINHFLCRLLHVDHHAVDLAHEVVVRDVDRNRDDKTGSRGDERHLDTAGDELGVHLTRRLDRRERGDHPDHRPEEAEERRYVRNGREPHQAALESGHLEETGVLDGLADALVPLVLTLQTGRQDASRRSLRFARQCVRLIDPPIDEELVYLTEELTRARPLDAQLDELPDDDDEPEQRTRAQEPHHPTAVVPRPDEPFGRGQLRAFNARNLQHGQGQGAETAQCCLRRCRRAAQRGVLCGTLDLTRIRNILDRSSINVKGTRKHRAPCCTPRSDRGPSGRDPEPRACTPWPYPDDCTGGSTDTPPAARPDARPPRIGASGRHRARAGQHITPYAPVLGQAPRRGARGCTGAWACGSRPRFFLSRRCALGT